MLELKKIEYLLPQIKNLFCDDYETLEVPEEFQNISIEDLLIKSKIKNGVFDLKSNKPFNKIKLALVSNWKMQCGIATYAENLFPELIKKAGHAKLFIEKNNYPTDDIL